MLIFLSSGAVTAAEDSVNVQISKASGINIVTAEDGTVIYKGSDDADAIEAAMDSIESGVIFLGEGTYSIDRTLGLKSDISFVGTDGTVINCDSSPAFDTGKGGYSSSTISLASNANSGDTKIKLSSVSGLKVGDYIKISDDFTVSYQEKLYKNGELAEIVSIDGTTITLDQALYDDYTVARNAKVRKISMFKNISFENLDFVGYGMDTTSTALSFYGTKNVTLKNCELEDFGTRGINLFDCLDCTFEGNTFKRIYKAGLGYGIAITNACDNIVIQNNSFLEKGRHYVAIVASRGGVTTDGFTRHVDILNNVFRDCADEAVNSHPTSAATINVIGNKFYDSRKGVEFSNSDSLIKNNSFYNCSNAVVSFTTGNHVIENNYFNGNRISVIPYATSNIIRNNVFDNGGYIMPELNAVIENNTFKNYASYIIYSAGSSSSYMENIEISNNTCQDSIKMAMKLVYCKNVEFKDNNLRGYLEFNSCEDVEIDGNKINSPSSKGVRILNAKGPHAITGNEINAASIGISLENTAETAINEEIVIRHNIIDAPTEIYNKGYSNVVVTEVLTASAGSDQEVSAGEVVTLDGSGSTDDLGIESYAWDFDASDGLQQDALGVTVQHSYDTAGTYTATLTVTDSDGNTDSDTVMITVSAAEDESSGQDSGEDSGQGSEEDSGQDSGQNSELLTGVQDSRLREGSPNTVFNDVRYIDVGGRDGTGAYRDLLFFDLSEYEDSETIENATLSLFWYYPEGKEREEDTIVEIYRPDSWNPDYVTWNSRALNTSWKNTGGDWYDKNNVSQGNTPYATLTLNGSDVPDNRYYEFDVTDLVKEYISGEYENTGFLIKARTESGNYVAFYSNDCGNEDCVPKLNITQKAENESTTLSEPTVLEDLEDSRLREGSPDTVFNDVRYIDVGGREGTGAYRDLLFFDLDESEDAENIENATLSLFWYYPEGKEREEDTIVEIYRPDSWNPDYVTWNSRALNTLWENAGGDWYDKNNVSYGTTPYATLTLNGSDVPDNRYYEFDVTDLVKEYVSGEYENTGFLIKARTESGNYIAFCSSDYKAENQRPKLTIFEKAYSESGD